MEIRNLRMERYTFFWAKRPLSPPKKKPASAAKPISVCLYKTLTLMLYNLINLPNLMGARCSSGQLVLVKTMSKKDSVWISFIEGLHQHAAIVMCLTCSDFNLKDNYINQGSLKNKAFKKCSCTSLQKPSEDANSSTQ